MQEDIRIKDIYGIIKKHIVKILLSIITGVMIAYLALIYLAVPQYSSEAQLLVTQDLDAGEMIQVSEIEQNIQMINTYRDIILGEAVLAQVNEHLGNKYTVNGLNRAISVEQSPNSQAFYIEVTESTPEKAQAIVQEVVVTFDEKIKEIYGDVGTQVYVLSPASFNPAKTSPNTTFFILIGLMFGLVIGGLIALLFELMDATIHGDEFLNQLGLNNLGPVDQMTNKELKNTRLRIKIENATFRE
ncbi:hypothetical protein GIY11_01935 [Aerococcaceae bacterium DSM 109653]|uniref:Capsular polysaccharide biosynthesis protein CpsC n=1 Tax=Fundicoccus ignavus TaxID=2664442 RepID=A0A844BZK8_9LACT|nr:Wzz/FepE/Etk N-terminal domain-containing protein [Fundicoccus ignavus]MRI80791.1 hypothetical protein [Fundicoccus ignavus]